MPGTEILTIRQGTGQRFPRQLTTDGTAPVTGFTGSETFALSLWAGDARAPIALATSAAAWDDFSLATFTIYVAATDIAALDPATYRLTATILGVSDGIPRDAFDGWLRVVGKAGAVAARPVYTTCDDLKRYFADVDSLQVASDQAGFVEQQADAREWLEEIIHRHDRGSGGLALYQQAVSDWGGGAGYRSGRRSPYLAGLLAADGLVLTARVREALCKRALAAILELQLGDNGAATPYQTLGQRFRVQADVIASTLTVEILTDTQGTNTIVVDLGATDVLYG